MALIDDLIKLPMHGQDPETATEPSCDEKKIYVSLEEKSILERIRALRDRAIELRTQLDQTEAEDRRFQIENELEQLREQRRKLETDREAAYKRKMIMLGHLPPEVDLL